MSARDDTCEEHTRISDHVNESDDVINASATTSASSFKIKERKKKEEKKTRRLASVASDATVCIAVDPNDDARLVIQTGDSELLTLSRVHHDALATNYRRGEEGQQRRTHCAATMAVPALRRLLHTTTTMMMLLVVVSQKCVHANGSAIPVQR